MKQDNNHMEREKEGEEIRKTMGSYKEKREKWNEKKKKKERKYERPWEVIKKRGKNEMKRRKRERIGRLGKQTWTPNSSSYSQSWRKE